MTDNNKTIADLRAELKQACVAYDQVQKDCKNLTEKVIPNLRTEVERLTKINSGICERSNRNLIQNARFSELIEKQAERIAELERELADSRRTQNYWKANHLAGNEVIATQSAALAKAREALISAIRCSGGVALITDCEEALAAIDALGQQQTIFGMRVVVAPTMPADQLSVVQDGTEVGRVENIAPPGQTEGEKGGK